MVWELGSDSIQIAAIIYHGAVTVSHSRLSFIYRSTTPTVDSSPSRLLPTHAHGLGYSCLKLPAFLSSSYNLSSVSSDPCLMTLADGHDGVWCVYVCLPYQPRVSGKIGDCGAWDDAGHEAQLSAHIILKWNTITGDLFFSPAPVFSNQPRGSSLS